MGYREDEKMRDRSKSDIADAQWLGERMVALVAELNLLKEPNRAAFVRACLNAAMKRQERLMAVAGAGSEDLERDF